MYLKSTGVHLETVKVKTIKTFKSKLHIQASLAQSKAYITDPAAAQ